MKLAVIGRGTAGSLAAARLRAKFPDADLTWYFDENKPTQAVGEGSTLALPFHLGRDINFRYAHFQEFNGNVKTAIYKKNWGSQGLGFFHSFPSPYTACHFNAKGLQSFVLDYLKDKLNIHSGSVTHDEINADFILDCSGAPDSLEDFNKAEYIPVNSVKVVQCPWDFATFNYTLALARPHGWVFAIPLSSRCSVGYLYNNNISTDDQIDADMQLVLGEIREKYGISNPTSENSFSFSNYYRKSNFSKNLVYNGNASFFLEPLEATSIDLVCVLNDMAVELLTTDLSLQHFNTAYEHHVLEREIVIMLHYFAGSIYDTEFWKYAKDRGECCLKNASDLSNFRQIINDALERNRAMGIQNLTNYFGSWPVVSFKENVEGLGIKDKMVELIGSTTYG